MVIAFTIYQTNNSSNGGVESITQVLERLKSYQAIILTNKETARTERWRKAGHEVEVGSWSLVGMNMRVSRLSKRRGVRLLHANDIKAMTCSGFGARLAGVPVIFNIRDVKLKGTYGANWRMARMLSDRILTLSEEMKRDLAARLPSAYGREEKGTDVIYSIVDFSRMHPLSSSERSALRKTLGIGEDEFAVVNVAAVMPKKQQLDLLRNLPGDPRGKGKMRIHFIGDYAPGKDSYAAECEKAICEGGLERQVSFHGFTGTVEQWYQAADVVLVASKREGLARCMIEALACGTPVVSFDVCSAREILERNGCGMVVSQGNWNGLFSALDKLKEEPSLRASQGQRGAEVASKMFEPSRIVSQYEELYARTANRQ